MTLRRNLVKRIGRSAAVLALFGSGFFGLTATPAFANVPPAGWSPVSNWSTNAACRAAGMAGEGAFEWTNFGCWTTIPPGQPAVWTLYVN